MTQMQAAKSGQITPEMQIVAEKEGMPPELLRDSLARGEVVIPVNKQHKIPPIGVGKGLKTKVNANIGTSSDSLDLDLEIRKAKMAVKAGADAIMDLSTGGNLTEIRKTIMKEVPVVIGTVPIYQAAIETIESRGGLVKMIFDRAKNIQRIDDGKFRLGGKNDRRRSILHPGKTGG